MRLFWTFVYYCLTVKEKETNQTRTFIELNYSISKGYQQVLCWLHTWLNGHSNENFSEEYKDSQSMRR